MKAIYWILLVLLASYAHAQNMRTVRKYLDMREYEKLRKKITQTLKNDSHDVVALYGYSLYYFDKLNPQFHLDSSYRYVVRAIEEYKKSKKTETYQPLTLETLLEHKQNIEEEAFNKALRFHKEEEYHSFVVRFPSASQLSQVIHLRDSLAFAKATQENTLQSYKSFLDKYPQSVHQPIVFERYHTLLYGHYAKTNSVASLATFIEQYPESPYREEAERMLFILFTADNSLESYRRFVMQYPKNKYVGQSWAWIWYLTEDKSRFSLDYPDFPSIDSIRWRIERDTAIFFPFYDQQKIGFINREGVEVIPPSFSQLMEDYTCEGVKEDFIITIDQQKLGAYNKLGQLIAPHRYEEISDFGMGLLKTKLNGKYGLRHKGGFDVIPEKYDEIVFLNTSLFKAKKEGKWGLVSFKDSVIYPFEFQQIETAKSMVIFQKDNKYMLRLKDALWEDAQKHKEMKFVHDAWEFTHEQFIKIKTFNKWGVRTLSDKVVLLAQYDDVQETAMGWIAEEEQKKIIYDKSGTQVSPLRYDQVIVGKKGYAFKNNQKWGVMDFSGNVFIQPIYDTLFFVGEEGIVLERDKKRFGYFYKEELTDFSRFKKLDIQTLRSNGKNTLKEPQPFIITEDANRKKGLLTGKGEMLIPNQYDHIQLVQDGYLIVAIGNKRGIIDLQGKTVLPISYDGVVFYDKDYFSVFAQKKFGIYHVASQTLIKPQYDALLRYYGKKDTLFIAKKEKLGIITLKNNVLADFQFDEIHYWNDSTLLGFHQGRWKLYNFYQKQFSSDVFETFKYLRNDDQEISIITYRSSGYGLLSNRYGRVIPEEYTQIVNLGTEQAPLYLAERAITQAGTYVLLHISANGKVIREQILKEDGYNKVACKD